MKLKKSESRSSLKDNEKALWIQGQIDKSHVIAYASMEAHKVLSEKNQKMAEGSGIGNIGHLVAMKPVYDFLKLVVWTGKTTVPRNSVVDEDGKLVPEVIRPVSCIICSGAGTGKTDLMEYLQSTPSVQLIDDFTSRDLSAKLKQERLTHILLGDLMSLFGHKASTVKLSLNMLRRVVEEGIFTDSYTGQMIKNRRIGLISAIPPDDFYSYEIQNLFKSGGLASRFIVARFQYSKTSISSIHESIAEGEEHDKPTELELPEKPRMVRMDKAVGKKIQDLALVLKSDAYGFRAHKQLRALVFASAASENRALTSDEDFLRIKWHSEFFSYVGKKL